MKAIQNLSYKFNSSTLNCFTFSYFKRFSYQSFFKSSKYFFSAYDEPANNESGVKPRLDRQSYNEQISGAERRTIPHERLIIKINS